MNSARELATLERCQALAFTLKDGLDGGCLYQHLALLAAGRMVGVGEFAQLLSTMNATRTPSDGLLGGISRHPYL
jgi:hypothetical protein